MSDNHEHPNYVKIWAILLVLLIISVIGPELGIRTLTLITAFGIAVIKALMVAKYFMHLNIEKRYVTFIFLTCLALMGVMVAGISPDVLKHDGQNWENHAAKVVVEAGMLEVAADHDAHGGEH